MHQDPIWRRCWGEGLEDRDRATPDDLDSLSNVQLASLENQRTPQVRQTPEAWLKGRVQRGEISTDELMRLPASALSQLGN